MKLIRLTRDDTDAEVSVLVNVDHIVTIRAGYSGGEVSRSYVDLDTELTTGGDLIIANETPKEIEHLVDQAEWPGGSCLYTDYIEHNYLRLVADGKITPKEPTA